MLNNTKKTDYDIEIEILNDLGLNYDIIKTKNTIYVYRVIVNTVYLTAFYDNGSRKKHVKRIFHQ